MKIKFLDHGLNIVKSLALSFILTLLLILIVSILLIVTPIKEATIPLLNTIIIIISIVVGSVYMSKKVDENGWLNGGIIGALYFLILLILNFLFIKPFIFDVYTASKFFISLVVGVIGGMIGVNMK